MDNGPERVSTELITEKINIIKDIDLNTLFNLNYNFDPLKGLIEQLLTNQEKLQKQIDGINSKENDREKQVKGLFGDLKLIKDTYANKDSFNSILELIKKINTKLKQYEDNFSESKFFNENLYIILVRNTIGLYKQKIDNLEKKNIESEPLDIKNEFNKLLKMAKENKEGEENLKKNNNKLKKHIDNQILQLNSKLELFLNNIGGVDENNGEEGKNLLKKFDLSGLNSFMEKVINLEDKLEDFSSIPLPNDLYEQIKNIENKKAEKTDFKKFKNDFKEFTEQVFENKENIDNILKDIEKMSKKISDINIEQENIKNMKMKNIEGSSPKEVKQSDNVDIEDKISLDVESLNKYLSKYVLKRDYDDFLKVNKEKINKIDDEIDKINNLINEMSNSLNKKAEVEDLSELRDFLITKLEGFNNECTKKFSDKNETLKYFKYFEEQIKNLLSTSKTKSDSHMPENWLLATKPITGFSCAACESYIGDLKSEKDKFIAWNKLPVKENGEKIYRMGNGFSKMLSMLNVDANGNVYLNQNVDSNNVNEDEIKIESKKKEKNNNKTLLIKNKSKKDLISILNENKKSNNKIGKRTQNNFFKEEQIKTTYLPKLKKEISVDNENMKEKEENPKITKIFKKSHSTLHLKENN